MKSFKRIACCFLTCLFIVLCFSSCRMADTVEHNIKKEADFFGTYRKMTFVNLYTNELLYSAEGYFSLRTTVNNQYQGQQEIALLFQIGPDEYKMDYFSIDNNVVYVIEQIENTHANPYHWEINWYIPIITTE